MNYDDILILKTIFLGDQGVGKTSILNRFANETYENNYKATIGLDFHTKNVLIEKKEVRLILYDTAGQEKFKSLIPMYLRDAKIIILVYDITARDSLNKALSWIDDNKLINTDEVIIALVGNKIDIENERQISIENSIEVANERGYIHAEVSAKTGLNIDSLFYLNIFEKISEKYKLKVLPSTNNHSNIEEGEIIETKSSKSSKKKKNSNKIINIKNSASVKMKKCCK